MCFRCAMQDLKSIFVGDGTVGKTAIITSYLRNDFSLVTPTVVQTSEIHLVVDEQAFRLQVCDTAGQEDYDRLRGLQYPNTNVVFICFSLVQGDSFSNVRRKWFPEVRHYLPHTPIVLVGTKLDCRDPLNQTHISMKMGKRLARKIGAIAYIECSAAMRKNITAVFDQGVRACMKTSPTLQRRICRFL